MKDGKFRAHACAAARALALALFVFFASSQPFLAQSFTYTFPGTPGNGAAAAQGSQPSGGNFSDFTATGVTQDSLGADLFATTGWSSSGAIDSSQFVSYSLTPNSGNITFLQQISFDVRRASGGPNNGQVSLFGNTAGTALASQSLALTGTLTNRFSTSPTSSRAKRSPSGSTPGILSRGEILFSITWRRQARPRTSRPTVPP